MDTPTYDWLTIFFVHEDYELTCKSNAILAEMMAAGAGRNNGVYLIRDSVTRIEDAEGGGVNVFRLSVSLLEKDVAKGSWSFRDLPVKINNEDRNCWKEAFRYIFRTVKSKRQMLISFSHGAAFGINYDIDRDERPQEDGRNPYYYLDAEDVRKIKAMPQWKSVDEELIKAVESGKIPVDGGEYFCRQLEMIWVSDLANTLEEVKGGKKLDLLLLNNCYMLTFDTCYYLRDQVDYILGTEGSLDAIGYGYQTLLNTINAKPGIDPLELGRQSIEGYKALYTSLGLMTELEEQAIHLIATAAFPEALDLFNQFVAILEKNLDKMAATLHEIRETEMQYVCCDVRNYAEHRLETVDAFLWIELVFQGCADYFTGTGLPEAFLRLRTEIVKAEYKGMFLQEWDTLRKNKYGYNGLSIFFPLAADIKVLSPLNDVPWCLYFANQLPSRWEDSWRRFLRKFY